MSFVLDFSRCGLALGDILVFRATRDEFEVASASGCEVKPISANRMGPSLSLRLMTRRLLGLSCDVPLSDREVAACWQIRKGSQSEDPLGDQGRHTTGGVPGVSAGNCAG